MKEEIDINGKKIWVIIEPHAQKGSKGGDPAEYFTASYDTLDAVGSPGGILFVEGGDLPKKFRSPVEALEYASEKLLNLV